MKGEKGEAKSRQMHMALPARPFPTSKPASPPGRPISFCVAAGPLAAPACNQPLRPRSQASCQSAIQPTYAKQPASQPDNPHTQPAS